MGERLLRRVPAHVSCIADVGRHGSRSQCPVNLADTAMAPWHRWFTAVWQTLAPVTRQKQPPLCDGTPPPPAPPPDALCM